MDYQFYGDEEKELRHRFLNDLEDNRHRRLAIEAMELAFMYARRAQDRTRNPKPEVKEEKETAAPAFYRTYTLRTFESGVVRVYNSSGLFIVSKSSINEAKQFIDNEVPEGRTE